MDGEGEGSSAGISLREFGRLVGVSGEAVRKAIADGRVPADCLGTKRAGSKLWPVVKDPAKAAKAWKANTDETQQRDTAAQSVGAKRARAEREGKPAPAPAPARAAKPAPSSAIRNPPPGSAGGDGEGDDPDDEIAPDGLPTVASSKRRQEMLKVRKLEREELVEIGRLVDKEVARAEMRELIVTARNTLLGVPTKAKAKIPTLTLRDIEILEDLIAAALKEVAAHVAIDPRAKAPA